MYRPLKSRRASPRTSRGITLVFALITLAVLTLAAVGLVRSVDTSARVLGNLGLKRDAVRYNDYAAEVAIAWIRAQSAETLQSDGVSAGYYASSQDALDPTGSQLNNASRALVDWDANNCAAAATGTYSACRAVAVVPAPDEDKGLSAAYVITRLCAASGNPNGAGNNCARPASTSTVSSPVRGSISYGDSLRATGVAGEYYRILVRTRSVRSTVAYTETIVHF